MGNLLSGQDLTIKIRSDFGLSGPVKKCSVLTSYGKEIYEFNRSGWLVKLTSYFDEHDYNVVQYQYSKMGLQEQRMEYYEGGVLNKSVSTANFYEMDSIGKHILSEKIVDYKGHFIEKIRYEYDSIHRLKSFNKESLKGRFTTLVSYEKDSLGSVYSRLYFLDRMLQKRIDSIPVKVAASKTSYINKTTEYVDAIPSKEVSLEFTTAGTLIKRSISYFNEETQQWILDTQNEYEYDSKGKLLTQKTVEGKSVYTQKFTYQSDGTPFSNWVKQIILPDLTYTTRIIEYFEEETP